MSVLLLGSAAYATALIGRFQFDDFHLIVDNPEVASLGAAWSSLPVSLRPLTKLTLALNVSAHGFRPFGFHLVNLALHLCSTLLLYRLVEGIRSWKGSAFPAAWCAAAIFLLHPAQTEAVTYISGRSTGLMTACMLFALWLALRADVARERAAAWRTGSMVAFVAAIAAKESALVFPLLYLIWLLALENRPWRPTLAAVWPYVLMSAACVVAFVWHPRYHGLIVDAATRLPWNETALSHVSAVAALLGVVICPWRVNIDHALPVARSLGDVWPQILILVVALLVGVWSSRQSRVFAGGVIWGLAALLPTQSFLVRQDLIADRMLYLPLVGLSIAMADLMARASAAAPLRAPRPAAMWRAAAVAVSLVLALFTVRRNLQYGSEVALWRDSVEKAPLNARAHHNLGYAYEQAGELEPAVREYRAAIALDPNTAGYRESLKIGLDKIMTADSGSAR